MEKRPESLWRVYLLDKLEVRNYQGMEIASFPVKELEKILFKDWISKLTIDKFYLMISILRFREDEKPCSICKRKSGSLEDDFFEVKAGFHRISRKEYGKTMKELILKHGILWELNVKKPLDKCPELLCYLSPQATLLKEERELPVYWRLIRGLNIAVKCPNPLCETEPWDSLIVLTKGTLDFRIDLDALDLNCLFCSTKIPDKNILSFVFIACDWKLTASNPSKKSSWTFGGKSHTFASYTNVKLSSLPQGARAFTIEACDCWAGIC